MSDLHERALTAEVIERWRGLLEQANADASWQQSRRQERELRETVAPKMLDFLRQYLAGSVNLREFQSTIDRRSKNDWDIYGIKGASGAMFLNMLVKNVPDSEAVDSWLRAALPVPVDEKSGQEQMRRFYDALSGLINSGQVKSRLIQAARTPFMLSAFWHLEDSENWPVYYLSARGVLGREGLFRESLSAAPVENYLAFRSIWLDLSKALNVNAFDLENLCLWIARHGQPDPQPPLPPEPPVVAPAPEPPIIEGNGSLHARAQWLLARIGKQLGLKVWIASNDRGKSWNGQVLGDFSIAALPPLGAGGATQRTVELIDVLWISGFNQIVAAFEVEHSTAIYSGLLRMSDLAVLAPLVSFPIYIVAPRDRLDDVRRQLRRPTFQALELHKRAAFFSIEDLARDADNIMRFATSAAAIDALAGRVDDVSGDEGWQ